MKIARTVALALVVSFLALFFLRSKGTQGLDEFLDSRRSPASHGTLRRLISIGETEEQRGARRRRLDQYQRRKIDELNQKNIPVFTEQGLTQEAIKQLDLSEEQCAVVARSRAEAYVKLQTELLSRMISIPTGSEDLIEYRVGAFPEVGQEIKDKFLADVQPLLGAPLANLASQIFESQTMSFFEMGRSDLSFVISKLEDTPNRESGWVIKVQSYVPSAEPSIFAGMKGFTFAAPSDEFIQRYGLFDSSTLSRVSPNPTSH